MSSVAQQPPLTPEVRSLLSGLRWRIRAYVWLEGLALAVIWVGLSFWAIFALDYLPILVGATEMPRAVRGVLLTITIVVLLYILYRWVLCRVFTRLADRSMAILLERRFQEFRDSLVTTVELSQRPKHAETFNPAMLGHTKEEALARIDDVRLRDVFNVGPLVGKVLLATLLVGSMAAFYVLGAPTFIQAADRIWLLGDNPWPRSSRIEIVGIEVQRSVGGSASSAPPPLIPFQNRRVKVAKGANVVLRVRAYGPPKVVPDYCMIQYRKESGDRGRAQMRKTGKLKEDEDSRQSFQHFVYDNDPFKGILTSLSFDVVGNDHRQSGYQVEVVDSPTLIDTTLACEFPKYMADEPSSSWLPREVAYLPTGTQLPRGTKITLKAKANKPLKQVQVFHPDTEKLETINVAGVDRFELPVRLLDSNLSLEISLHDTDNVLSDRPQRIIVAAIPDEAPRIEAKLRGIGTMVTPDVVIPVQGKVSDDYGVADTWFDLLVNDGEIQKQPFKLRDAGELRTELDFKKMRALETAAIELKPTDKLNLKVSASDKCDLGTGPNIGGGDQYQLDVVSPEELLAHLEVREVSIRRRFEQIIAEVTVMRDELQRIRTSDEEAEKKGADPSDKRKTADEPGEATPKATPEQKAAERQFRVQRSIQQSLKSGQEVLGVAIAFADIREELVNNRVDTKDREGRLKEQIADPLRQIAEKSFPELDRRLAVLEKQLADAQSRDAAAQSAVQQNEQVLLELNNVLQNMLDLETYNELLDIIRDLIKHQQELKEKTQQEKKKQLLDLTK